MVVSEHHNSPAPPPDDATAGCGAGCDHAHSHHARPSAPASGLRPAIERASLPLLTVIARLPVWLPFLLVLALILGGAWLGGVVGSVAVGAALLAVAWLLYLSWPRLTGIERLMRLAVVFLVVAVAATQLIPS